MQHGRHCTKTARDASPSRSHPNTTRSSTESQSTNPNGSFTTLCNCKAMGALTSAQDDNCKPKESPTIDWARHSASGQQHSRFLSTVRQASASARTTVTVRSGPHTKQPVDTSAFPLFFFFTCATITPHLGATVVGACPTMCLHTSTGLHLSLVV